MTTRSKRAGVAACVAAPLLLVAGTGTATAASHGVAAARAPHVASFTARCSALRAKFPGLPKTIDVAVSPYNPPSESINPKDPSQIVGLEPSVVADVGRCLGFTYTYTSEGFANVITSLQSGRSPLGITALYVTPARQKIIAFVPYRTAEDQIVTTSALASKLKAPMSLCGLSTGVTTGSVELAYMQKLSAQCKASGKQAISIGIYQDISTVFASMAAGHIDFTSNAAELTPPVLKQYKGKLAGSFLVKALSFTVAIGIEKSQAELGHAVAGSIQAMQATGMEKALLKKWGYPVSTQKAATFVG